VRHHLLGTPHIFPTQKTLPETAFSFQTNDAFGGHSDAQLCTAFAREQSRHDKKKKSIYLSWRPGKKATARIRNETFCAIWRAQTMLLIGNWLFGQ
jgi:hypothetical protein